MVIHACTNQDKIKHPTCSHRFITTHLAWAFCTIHCLVIPEMINSIGLRGFWNTSKIIH